jgi:hypothetical protein
MRHAPRSSPLETCIQAAWPAQLATAVKTPDVVSALVCYHRLLPRVAAYYTQLQALPRRVRRALQRQLGLPLATLALWLALGQLPALAATIAVGGDCTLVDAITAANTDTACVQPTALHRAKTPKISRSRAIKLPSARYGNACGRGCTDA